MTFQVWKRPLAGGLVIAAGLLALPYGNAQEGTEVAWQSGDAQEGSEVVWRTDSDNEGSQGVVVELRQQEGPRIKLAPPLDVLKQKRDVIYAATDGLQKRVIALRGGPESTQALRAAAAAVNDAEDDDAKRQAQERLEELLDDYFDDDMKRREQELQDIEDRVKKLQAQLERRREKRREIVDLQMQVLLNEADGLGFFGGDMFFMGPGKGFEFNVQPFAAPAMVQHPPGAPGATLFVQPPRVPGPAVQPVPVAQPAPAVQPVPPSEPARRRERERERERRQREREEERNRERENDRDGDGDGDG